MPFPPFSVRGPHYPVVHSVLFSEAFQSHKKLNNAKLNTRFLYSIE